jgi:NAD(P)-dependent dehydrogenase (short-subunit alcohol dehydrogenase family)
VAARREDRLKELLAEAGHGTLHVGDVRDHDDCRRIVDEAVAALGGLDLLVHASGITPLVLMADETPAGWREVFETNTVGALTVITAAIPKLSADGLIAYIGSDSVGAPYHGLVPYGASKAALDEGVRGLRMEYPDVRFTRVAVGPTAGTEIGWNMDPDLGERLLPEWLRNARAFERQMEAGDLGELIVACLAPALAHRDIEMEEILFKAPGGTLPWGTDVQVLIENNKKFQATVD